MEWRVPLVCGSQSALFQDAVVRCNEAGFVTGKNCTSSTVWRLYFHNIFRIFLEYFPYHGKHFHSMELDKNMEIGFSNLFLQYFQNISILWKRSNVSSVFQSHYHLKLFGSIKFSSRNDSSWEPRKANLRWIIVLLQCVFMLDELC